MSEPIKDSEALPCIGGPMDGDTREIVILPGAISPVSSFTARIGNRFYRYTLNVARRAWMFDSVSVRRDGK